MKYIEIYRYGPWPGWWRMSEWMEWKKWEEKSHVADIIKIRFESWRRKATEHGWCLWIAIKVGMQLFDRHKQKAKQNGLWMVYVGIHKDYTNIYICNIDHISMAQSVYIDILYLSSQFSHSDVDYQQRITQLRGPTHSNIN